MPRKGIHVKDPTLELVQDPHPVLASRDIVGARLEGQDLQHFRRCRLHLDQLIPKRGGPNSSLSVRDAGHGDRHAALAPDRFEVFSGRRVDACQTDSCPDPDGSRRYVDAGSVESRSREGRSPR